MLTFWFISWDKVVAAVPMLILDISPIASFSASVRPPSGTETGEGEAEGVFMLFKSALISSCESMPSISLFLLRYNL